MKFDSKKNFRKLWVKYTYIFDNKTPIKKVKNDKKRTKHRNK